MATTTRHDPPPGTSATISRLPVPDLLGTDAAARYMGITPLRLRFLQQLKIGPTPSRIHGQRGKRGYRKEELDAYLSSLYVKADISMAEMHRRRSSSVYGAHAIPGYPRNPQIVTTRQDAFIEMATRADVISAMMSVGLRIAIVAGLALIILSHTPLFWHFLRHGPYGDI